MSEGWRSWQAYRLYSPNYSTTIEIFFNYSNWTIWAIDVFKSNMSHWKVLLVIWTRSWLIDPKKKFSPSKCPPTSFHASIFPVVSSLHSTTVVIWPSEKNKVQVMVMQRIKSHPSRPPMAIYLLAMTTTTI